MNVINHWRFAATFDFTTYNVRLEVWELSESLLSFRRFAAMFRGVNFDEILDGGILLFFLI